MSDALHDELERGAQLALALVDHLDAMGGASSAVIPVLDRSEEFVVIVVPRRDYDLLQQAAPTILSVIS